MKKEDIILIAQLLETMKELSEKLEGNYNDEDIPNMNKTKKEILQIQRRIREIL